MGIKSEPLPSFAFDPYDELMEDFTLDRYADEGIRL